MFSFLLNVATGTVPVVTSDRIHKKVATGTVPMATPNKYHNNLQILHS